MLVEVMPFTVGARVVTTAELVLKDTVTTVPEGPMDVIDTGTTDGVVITITD